MLARCGLHSYLTRRFTCRGLRHHGRLPGGRIAPAAPYRLLERLDTGHEVVSNDFLVLELVYEGKVRSASHRRWLNPEVSPLGKSFCPVSPVITMREWRPRRVIAVSQR
jgi:hypothetical protein